MVLVSKEQRRTIFKYLLREGVIVVKKDAYLPFHQHITSVPNLQVMMISNHLSQEDASTKLTTGDGHTTSSPKMVLDTSSKNSVSQLIPRSYQPPTPRRRRLQLQLPLLKAENERVMKKLKKASPREGDQH